MAVSYLRQKQLYIGLWQLDSGALAREYGPYGEHCARHLEFNPGGDKLALDINCFVKVDASSVRRRKELVVVVDVASGQELGLWGRSLYYDRVGFAGDDELLLTSRSGSVFRWSLSMQRVLEEQKRRYGTQAKLSPNEYAYQAEHKRYAMQDDDRSPIKLFDVASNKTTPLPGGDDGAYKQRAKLVFSPDGATLAVAEKRGLELYNLRTQSLVTTLAYPEDFSLSWMRTPHGVDGDLEFHPQGHMLAAGTGNKVLIWDVETQKVLWQRSSGPSSVVQLAFHPSRERLALSSDDGVIRLYDHAADRLLWELVFFPEGEWLLHRPGDARYLSSAQGDAWSCLWVEGSALTSYALRDFRKLLKKDKLPSASAPLAWPSDALVGKTACRVQGDGLNKRAAVFQRWLLIAGGVLFLLGALAGFALRKKAKARSTRK